MMVGEIEVTSKQNGVWSGDLYVAVARMELMLKALDQVGVVHRQATVDESDHGCMVSVWPSPPKTDREKALSPITIYMGFVHAIELEFFVNSRYACDSAVDYAAAAASTKSAITRLLEVEDG